MLSLGRVRFLLPLTVALLTSFSPAQTAAPVRVAIVGLVHGHVEGIFHQLPQNPQVTLVGISEPDPALRQKYIARTHLPANLFFATEAEMLAKTRPQAVLVYTSIAGHRAAIAEAARLHIASMVEKPLATTVADAEAIEQASKTYGVPVLTNYETTWYASNRGVHALAEAGKLGELRKMVVHDGHRGPKEIGVSPEFLAWLTDPVQNGGGALMDFGCYGVDLATWFMHGELPLTVTAVTLHIKPAIYPRVDDDATIVMTYPRAQVIVQGSWNWPFDRKDMEVYGATGYADTVYVSTEVTNKMRVRLAGEAAEHPETAAPLPAPEDSSLHYLAAVLHGELKPEHDLSSLDTNVTVVKILAAARTSAETGRTVRLMPPMAAQR